MNPTFWKSISLNSSTVTLLLDLAGTDHLTSIMFLTLLLCYWWHCFHLSADEVTGVTYLNNVVYIVCRGSSTIRLYNMDASACSPFVIDVDGMTYPRDIVVCLDDRALYVADFSYSGSLRIWRASVDDHSYVTWLTLSSADTFNVWTLSLTSRHLLVTSSQSCTLEQYSTVDKQLLRIVRLPRFVNGLYHSVETTRQTFVIGYGCTSQDKWQWAVSELFVFSK